jgi:flavin-dependent dehydrogenase
MSPEITVLGGGPAGATASLLLASWGHDVRVITKAGVDHRLAVSLPPSCGKLFDAIGIGDAVERANFIRSAGNTVWWGGQDARVEPFASDARGWQLDAPGLADVILQRAAAAGVTIERRMVIDPPPGFVIDCTGRAGIVARARNLRRQDPGPRTIALVAEWHRDTWPVPDDTHTLIESYDDGWVWSVPVGSGIRHIAAMVDPQRSGLARGGSSKQVYLAEIGKTREFARLTADATLGDGPWGWDASQYDAIEYAGEDWMLAGDAGSFIDPLSSAGVKKALASGWLAAIVAHTILESPSMKAPATAFFNEREREIAAHLQHESRRFLTEAAPGHPHAFWDERSDEFSPMLSTRSERVLNIDREAVGRAFERIRAADRFQVRLGQGVSIEPRPMIRGHQIVLEPHLVPGGIRYVSGIDVVALVELAPAASQVPDVYETYVKRAGSAPLHDFLHALATAVAKGWLVAE